MRIAAIIPSLNPDERFLTVAAALSQAGFEHIILVDDGSRPDCRIWFDRAMELPGCVLLRHPENRGKGRALKTAFEWFLRNCPDDLGVVTVDGDGQHEIGDILNCARELELHPDALVLGARNFKQAGIPARSRFGNRFTSGVFRYLCGITASDTQTGLRGIPAAFAGRLMDVAGERFDFETNMLLETNQAGIRIREVPIRTVYLEENKSSHFRPLLDSWRIYKLIGGYISSAIISAALDLGLFTLARHAVSFLPAHLRILAATVFARIFSSIFNYFANRNLVFRSKKGRGGSITRYYLLFFCQMLCSSGGVYLLSRYLHLHEVFAKVVVDGILFLFSFKIQQSWVFAKADKGGSQ